MWAEHQDADAVRAAMDHESLWFVSIGDTVVLDAAGQRMFNAKDEGLATMMAEQYGTRSRYIVSPTQVFTRERDTSGVAAATH